MPSFYPRHMPRHMPLTPPEFVPSYNNNNNNACGNMQYQQPTYAAQQGHRQQDESYDFADRYNQLSIAVPPMYPQAGTYLSNAPPALPPQTTYYEPIGAPILPPMRMQSGPRMGDPSMHQQRPREQIQRAAPPAKDENKIGGVSAKLDYEMEIMTDFVTEMASGIIQPGRALPTSYRKWIHQVLCATRLPSATILLSLHYLTQRMTQINSGSPGSQDDTMLYRTVTVALILGSKFLDDNTFINRSWAEVSGINVLILNEMERDWLCAIDFKLHRDPDEQSGWCSWSDHWQQYNSARLGRATNKLSPIDTTVQRQRIPNQNKPLPPTPHQQAHAQPPAYEYPRSQQSQYSAASYTHYDPWLVPRSATDNSPASAPTTGPTTPDYYGGPGTWGAPEGYSRRTMFGFPSMSQPQHQSQPHQQPANYGPPAYTPQYNNAPAWNSHPVNCGCVYCSQRQPSYFMSQGYGPQTVAG